MGIDQKGNLAVTVKIYPNPANSYFYIHTGNYLVKVHTSEGPFTKQIVIN